MAKKTIGNYDKFEELEKDIPKNQEAQDKSPTKDVDPDTAEKVFRFLQQLEGTADITTAKKLFFLYQSKEDILSGFDIEKEDLGEIIRFILKQKLVPSEKMMLLYLVSFRKYELAPSMHGTNKDLSVAYRVGLDALKGLIKKRWINQVEELKNKVKKINLTPFFERYMIYKQEERESSDQ